MSQSISSDSDGEIIDIGHGRPRRRRWLWLIVLGILGLLFVSGRGLSIYISALWFDSLGYSSVYWYMFRLKVELFVIFFILTVLILRGGFWLVDKAFKAYVLERRTIIINQQPVNISPTRVLRPLAWVVSVIAGLFFGLGMSDDWQQFALYTHQAPTDLTDPIFNKGLGFYLFTLPIHQTISEWLVYLAFIILCGAIVYTVLAFTQQTTISAASNVALRRAIIAPVSCALATWLVILAWRVFLSRYPYLWDDHQVFSGVTYTEANYVLPGLLFVAGALVLAAIIVMVNAFTGRRLRFLIFGLAIPGAVYVVATILIPAYVTSFIVKPNELGRETPYIKANIEWTRRGFGLERVDVREFDPDSSIAGFDLDNTRPTVDNVRLWDWTALRQALHQHQTLKPYYDFPDVDVDRYKISGQTRQMMLAARELDVTKLPEQSRTWINERLIYTHGYGLTMNTVNEFTTGGDPRYVLSNMPVESSAPEIKLTRPEIYFGQKTDTDVYVKTKQREFNYPSGETDNTNIYEGTGGIPVGGFFRRLILASESDDLSKLPFSDDVTSESRLLMRRNIRARVEALAPFLVYDNDPYIVVSDSGRLVWIIDAFTESTNYPYSRHYQAGDRTVNYMRNSVKVTIDAYDGSVDFFIFDKDDPLIKTYRAIFPALFKDETQMPADLRAHVRYPETLFRTQADVFGVYHVTDASVFFRRDDVWSVANQYTQNKEKQETAPLEPYFVLMQLPGEQTQNEFVEILPFTPAGRSNMTGWLAGRSDGKAYGSLLVYNFPKSRQIDGPTQIEARINQDPALSRSITLLNSGGSRLLRGNLLVIPIGRSILYVEPIFLLSESNAIPRLVLVVLATHERLEFGETTDADPRPPFDIAREKLFGKSGGTATQPKEQGVKPQPNASPTPSPSPSPQPIGAPNVQQLVNRALQEFQEYQRLTSEGKLAEAGKKLEEHKRTLEELKKATGKP